MSRNVPILLMENIISEISAGKGCIQSHLYSKFKIFFATCCHNSISRVVCNLKLFSCFLIVPGVSLSDLKYERMDEGVIAICMTGGTCQLVPSDNTIMDVQAGGGLELYQPEPMAKGETNELTL